MRAMSDSAGARLAAFLRERYVDDPGVTDAAQRLGDGVELLWEQLTSGHDLLWLAGVVGVDPRTVARVALQALSEAGNALGWDQCEYETWQVLHTGEEVLAGTGSERELRDAGWDAYDLIAYSRDDRLPLSEAGDTVMDATVYAARAVLWAAHASDVCPEGEGCRYRDGDHQEAPMVLRRLAKLGLLHVGQDGEEATRDVDLSSDYWGRFVRDRIDAAQVNTAMNRILDGLPKT